MPVARFPLAVPIQSRTASTAKDSRLVNGMIEGEEVVKRPGLAQWTTTQAGQGQGIFSYRGRIISAVGGHIWQTVGDFSSPSATSSEISGSPYTGMSSILPLSFAQTATDKYLVWHDGANIYYSLWNSVTGSMGTITNALGGTTVASISVTSQGGFYGTTTAITGISLASPGVVTWTAHGLVTGQGVYFYTLTGTLPAEITQYQTYQVVAIDANTFSLKTTGLAAAAVNTTTASTGTIYAAASPTVTLSGGGGAGALATAVIATGSNLSANHQVSSIVVNNVGAGYTTGTPTVTLSAPAAGTTATARLSGVLSSATYYNQSNYTLFDLSSITSTGSGYVTPPSITFPTSPEIGLPATGHSTINSSGQVTDITITNPTGNLYLISNLSGVTLNDPAYPYITCDVTIAAPVTTTATATAVMSNASITGPFAAGIVYLDGSVYVLKNEDNLVAGSAGTIYGSAMNDPTTWNVLNSIIAGSGTDKLVGIARHLNYLVAFGTVGMEFFYDAALPLPGSALENNRSAYVEIGCANGYSIAQAEQTIIWVGTSLTEGRAVYLLSGTSPIKISTRYIDKYLNACNMTNNTTNQVRAYCIKINGHSLYILNLHDINTTLVYDLDEKKWYQWSSTTSTAGTTTGVETYFNPTSFTSNGEYGPGLYLQGDDDGIVYKMSSSNLDDGTNKAIYFRVVTPILDSGTTKRKFYKSVEVVGDKVSGTMYIRKYDNDYSTPSTWRSVTLSDERPILYQGGSARRRSYEVFNSDSIAIRLVGLEVSYDIGEQGAGQEG